MRIYYSLLVCCFCYGLAAQKYSNEFLNIGVSARAQALGNAVVATTTDVTAGYWNPAGLARTPADEGLQLGAMHSPWFAGAASFNYLGVSIPLADGRKRFALNLVRFGIDDIPNTLSLYEDDGTINYDRIVSFSAADYGIFGSYAQPMAVKKGDLQVGGSAKIVRRTIGEFANSWGFGIDLGAQYQVGNWQLGLLGRDITTTFNSWTTNFSDADKAVLLATGNELPDINSIETTLPQFLLGAAYTFTFEKMRLTPEFNLHLTTDGRRNTLVSADPISIDPTFGVELLYNEFIFFRGGVNQVQRESDFDRDEYFTARPSLGIGLLLKSLQIDYAFTDVGDSRNTFSHVVSLRLSLKPKT